MAVTAQLTVRLLVFPVLAILVAGASDQLFRNGEVGDTAGTVPARLQQQQEEDVGAAASWLLQQSNEAAVATLARDCKYWT